MGITATCSRCGREFSLFQLYHAAPADADRCPHCSQRLGILHIGPLAERADAALERLAAYLTMLSEHQPAFRIRAESVTDPLADAVSATPSSQWASTGRSQPRQRRPATAEIASVALG